jgi:hypothetical protein
MDEMLHKQIAAITEHIKECNAWWKIAFRESSSARMQTNEDRRLAFLVSIGTLLLVSEGKEIKQTDAIWRAGAYFEAVGINWRSVT